MNGTVGIVWFRRDLRLADNPALTAAIKQCSRVVLLFIWSPEEENPWPPGRASRVWLHASLRSLEREIAERGGQLVLRQGNSVDVVGSIAAKTGGTSVFWNRLYEPSIMKRDAAVQAMLKEHGIAWKSFKADLLLEPEETRKKDGTPYQVFTPFANSYGNKLQLQEPLPAPQSLRCVKDIEALPVESLALKSPLPWAEEIMADWSPGEAGANHALDQFVKSGLRDYTTTRNLPGNERGISRLSPHLHFGEVSSLQIWWHVSHGKPQRGELPGESIGVYKKEILWREFSHQLLYHFPTMPERALRQQFDSYPWVANDEHLHAWQRGQTGYPIVDAGMRQLWQTGWMHNRVRMIAASFLIKDLGIAWQTGEEWFWDTLVDADLAQNAMNWQWVAGCGADAAPFFRIFNPSLQGKKFDANGDYIRKYVPELAGLPAKWIHTPAEAPREVLADAGVDLGKTYPHPIVDHAKARDHALVNYKKLR